MNTRQQKAAQRIRELIEEGNKVAALEKPSSVGPYIRDNIALNSWRVKVDNIFKIVFGSESTHYKHLVSALEGYTQHSYEVDRIVGILEGGLNDLEKGFLIGQELLIAGDIFDSIVEQARYLARQGFKDPAAVLVRVVIEEALQRISQQEGIDPNLKASALNDALRDRERYPKPQWRIIQSWLDIGNSAAHGKFSDYTKDDVLRMIEDVERFLAQELRQ